MTPSDLQDELPAGWTVQPFRRDGMIEVIHDTEALVIAGKDWNWVKQRVISHTLSHRGEA